MNQDLAKQHNKLSYWTLKKAKSTSEMSETLQQLSDIEHIINLGDFPTFA